jgi:hypothetical protein
MPEIRNQRSEKQKGEPDVGLLPPAAANPKSAIENPKIKKEWPGNPRH